MTSTESLNNKKVMSDSLLKKSFNSSTDIIATTNSKGEIVPKRPDKLNISKNINKQLTEEIEAVLERKELFKSSCNVESMETVKLEDDSGKEEFFDESDKDKAGSPFYADPVDTLKEVYYYFITN